jgi:hypothetical protein
MEEFFGMAQNYFSQRIKNILKYRTEFVGIAKAGQT